MVDIQFTESEVGLVVRFQRERWSALLGRNFMMTDLITVIRPELEADLRADFELYRSLDEPSQMAFVAHLYGACYTGRLLEKPTLPAEAMQENTVAEDVVQPSLF
jgi:hypothetical protein